MPNEWKIGAATESELEKHLQSLDSDGFEVHDIFPVHESRMTRFVVVGRRELPQGHGRRHYQARPVSLRCSTSLPRIAPDRTTASMRARSQRVA